MPTRVVVPYLGESVASGVVERWLKQEGSRVEQAEALLEVNTDKVSVEIASPAAGTLLQILVAEGEAVAVGATLGWIGAVGEAVLGDGGVGKGIRGRGLAGGQLAEGRRPETEDREYGPAPPTRDV